MKDHLLSHVSHEFRTPLMAILWYARNLFDGREGELTPGQRNALGVTLRNAQQLGTMIGDLLESTQAQTGKLAIEPQCLSLVEVIPETLRTPEASAAAKQIRLSADVHGFLPPVYAHADRVRQILINLIENAIKFTLEHGTVQVQASLYQEIPAFMCVAVCVTGCGISPRARAKFSSDLVGPDVEIEISTMTIETPPESQEWPEVLVNTIASRIEGLKHRAV